MLGFLRARAVEGLEHCDDYQYQRTFEANGHLGIVSICADQAKHAVIATIQVTKALSISPIAKRVQMLLDVDADMQAIESTLNADERLKRLTDMEGVRVPGAWDPFELGVRAILGQQVTVGAARTLVGRLCSAFGRRIDDEESETFAHLFPTPDALAEAEIEIIGVPRRRADGVRALARAVASGDLQLDPRADAQAVGNQLRALPGIGNWTVKYMRMRAFKDPDAFPAEDVALVKAARSLDIASSVSELQQAAERWRPWRAYAAVRLWRSLHATQSAAT